MQSIKSLLKTIVYKTIGPRIFYKTAILPDGRKIRVDSTDLLGKRLLEQKPTSDAFELNLIEKNLKPGDVCIDVGANIGLYSLTMSKIVGKDGKVFSFEPSSKTFGILQQNIKINSIKNIVANQMGVSDKVGSADFFVTLQSGLAGLGNTGRGTVVQKETVKLVTLDKYFEGQNIDKVNFLKIDVEGFEGQVLKGAERLLRAQDDLKIMVELDEKNFKSFGFDVADSIRFLNSLGYTGWQINREEKTITKIEGVNPPGVNFIFATGSDTFV